MSSTRDFKNPGIFADDASTTIPPTPIAGVAYRDAILGADATPDGWKYGTRVDSKDWNQIMFLITSVLDMLDRKGILGWSNQVDYTEPGYVMGSDGNTYRWVQESGPSSLAGFRDPVTEPAYWAVGVAPDATTVIKGLVELATNAEVATGTSTTLVPSVASILSLFSRISFSAADSIRIPDRAGGLIIRWGTYTNATITDGVADNIVFPSAFPNSALQVYVSDSGTLANQIRSWKAINLTNSQFQLTSVRVLGADVAGTARWLAIGF